MPPTETPTATDPATLQAAIEAWVAAETGRPATVTDLRRLAGGACHEAWSLDLSLAGEGEPRRLVLRRDGGGSMNPDALGRLEEFRVLVAAHAAGVPVPTPHWATPDLLGRRAFLMDRLEGETVGRRIVQARSLAAARAALPAQLGAALARIHAIDWPAASLDFLPRPGAGVAPAAHAIDLWARQLAAMDEPHPALELALRWLRQHLPPPGPLTFVHGDFRVGNLMVGPEGLRAVLDWEFAHLGDPAEDLAWGTIRHWRFGVDHRKLGGVGDVAPLHAAYERAAGRTIDPDRVFFWEVMGNLAWAIGALAQCRRHLRGDEPSVELASLGRICAEMEYELLDLIERKG